MTEASKEDVVVALDWVPCICYSIWFKKSEIEVQALFNSGSEVNAMTPGYASKLGLKVRFIDIRAQKIDGSTLKTFGMVLASFQVKNTLGRARFFQETFLLADLSIEVVLRMPFLTLSNADIKFAQKELTWRSYTTAEALPTTKRVEIIDRKEFAKAALDENVEAFVVHVTSLSLNSMPIHPAREAQIASLVIEEVQIPELDEHVEAFVVHVTSLSTMPIYPAREAQIASLVAEEVKIPTEYSDFSNVFLEEKASILPEATELNQHAIELQEGQQPPYGPIYSLGPVELEMLKTYIETNLANSFIRPSKSPAGAPQRGSPSWTSPVPIIEQGSRKATNGRRLSEPAMAISSIK